jgi:hypothetical protein
MAYPKDNSEAATFVSGDLLWFSRDTLDRTIDADNIIDHLTTDSLAEGATNLYFTSERVDDRTAAFIQNGTGITWVHDDGLNTLTPTINLSSFTTSNLAEATTIKYVYEVTSPPIGDAAIKALNSTPQAVVTGGGSQLVLFVGAIVQSVNTLTGYTNNGLDLVDSTTGNIIASVPAGAIDHTTTTHYEFVTTGTGVLMTPGANLMLKAKTADPTGGNAANTLSVKCWYRLVTF